MVVIQHKRKMLKHYKVTVQINLKKDLGELVKIDLFEPIGLIFGNTNGSLVSCLNVFHSFKMLLNSFTLTFHSPTMVRSRSLEGYYNFQRCCGKQYSSTTKNLSFLTCSINTMVKIFRRSRCRYYFFDLIVKNILTRSPNVLPLA